MSWQASPGTLPEKRTLPLYGEEVSYRDSAPDSSLPVLVLVHGVGSSVETWQPVFSLLSSSHRLLAVDLLGHGSSPSQGDHSLGAQAASIRDLLEHLGVSSASFVGHSLGGGVVLQLAYLFPSLVQRIVLVSSGGLGKKVSPLLRLASLPLASLLVPLLFWRWPASARHLGGRFFRSRNQEVPPDLLEASATFLVLSHAQSRHSFFATLRSVVDGGGQYVSALGKLPSLSAPLLLVWGEKDPVIPLTHARQASSLLSAPLVVLPGGHFPHRTSPERFAAVVEDFLSASPLS